MNLHRQKVSCPFSVKYSVISKLWGCEAVLAVSHLFAVHINIISRFHSLEGNINPPSRPLQAGSTSKLFLYRPTGFIIYGAAGRTRWNHIYSATASGHSYKWKNQIPGASSCLEVAGLTSTHPPHSAYNLLYKIPDISPCASAGSGEPPATSQPPPSPVKYRT